MQVSWRLEDRGVRDYSFLMFLTISTYSVVTMYFLQTKNKEINHSNFSCKHESIWLKQREGRTCQEAGQNMPP